MDAKLKASVLGQKCNNKNWLQKLEGLHFHTAAGRAVLWSYARRYPGRPAEGEPRYTWLYDIARVRAPRHENQPLTTQRWSTIHEDMIVKGIGAFYRSTMMYVRSRLWTKTEACLNGTSSLFRPRIDTQRHTGITYIDSNIQNIHVRLANDSYRGG